MGGGGIGALPGGLGGGEGDPGGLGGDAGGSGFAHGLETSCPVIITSDHSPVLPSGLSGSKSE